jgi:5'(3')-deoxyribonucleotidase
MKNIGGLALDIDETLSRTNYFWVEYLQLKLGNPENLSIEEMEIKYKYAGDPKYWQTENGLNLMEEMRNDSAFQENLPLIENSNTVVQKINKIIPIRAYITARPDSVLKGTEAWLKKHNFPKAKIITRPLEVKAEDGNKWKARILEEFYPEIIGIIDDNPGLIDCLSSNYMGTVFLYKGISEHMRKDINVVSCKDWQTVWREVKRVLG